MTQATVDGLTALGRGDLDAALGNLNPEQAEKLLRYWPFWARPDQLPPEGEWSTWWMNHGRGAGKTRAAAEWVRDRVEKGDAKRICLLARTPGDARDVMLEGESGILAVSSPDFMPVYTPSLKKVVWPNGALGLIFSSENPEALRGPQFDTAWCDEFRTYKTPRAAWDNLQMGMRLGDPKTVVTSTPKPLRVIREIMAARTTVVTHATTYDNRLNLPEVFFQQIIQRYEGTSLGRQELNAEVLEEAEGALWQRKWIEEKRISETKLPSMDRIVVAIDPAVTSNEDSDETGIIVGGITGRGESCQGFILEDGSGRHSPDKWAKTAVELYDKWSADLIVGEANNGGDLVENTIRTVKGSVNYKKVHASRGKAIRAEPVAAFYEQGRVHHAGGFPDLEDQLCNWEQGVDKSPDRLDALVWALTELMIEGYQGGMEVITGTKQSRWK